MHFPPLLNKKRKKTVLTRGDKVLSRWTLKDNGVAKDISTFDSVVPWVIIETLEDKGSPLVSGTGVNLDDGSVALRGRINIEIDLSSVTDDQIDYQLDALIELVLLKGVDQNTVGPFELIIKQDGQ